MRSCSALLAAAAALAAEPGAQIEAIGTVGADSAATVKIDAPAENLIVTWTSPPGAMVAAGDPLIRYDTRMIAARAEDLRRAAAIARLEYERDAANRAAELEGLERERRRLRAELAALRAGIAADAAGDSDAIGLLRLELATAERAAAAAQREHERIAAEAAEGRASLLQLESAARAAEDAVAAIAGARLALELAERPPEESLDLAARRLRAESLAVQLGIGPDGNEDPGLGIGGRIAAMRSQHEAANAGRRRELEQSEGDARDAERALRDRTPLAWLRVEPAAGGAPLAQVRFLPEGRSAPEGWTADHGSIAAGAAGWDRALGADELLWRDPPEAAGAPPSDGGRQRSGRRSGPPGGGRPPGAGRRRGGGAAGQGGGVALIAEPATWRLPLPAGTYMVTVALGDDRSWDGAALRIEGQVVALPGRIEAGQREFSQRVEVADGVLDVAVGDGERKASRAPSAGVFLPQGHASVGSPVRDASWTLAVVAPPSAWVVDALVPQDAAAWLAPQRAAPPAGAPLAERIALDRVEAVRRDGVRLPARVETVAAQSVANTRSGRSWSGAEQADLLMREVRLRIEGDPGGQGSTVALRFVFAVPADATLLPPHLVRFDRRGAWLRPAGAAGDVAVEAVRIGDAVAVAGSFAVDGLLPPSATDGVDADAAGRYRGEVEPGGRTRVSLPWLWGRVESMVPDGSMVEAGQIVMTVYDPSLDADAERRERDRRAAVQRIVAAAEQRRQGIIRAEAEHRGRVIAEQEARLRLRRREDPDPARARERSEGNRRALAAHAAARLHAERLARLSAPDADEVALAAAAVRRAELGVDRAALEEAAFLLRQDWAASLQTAAAWSEAVAALARREAEVAESHVQERISTLSDRLAMERAAEGDRWAAWFEQRRSIKAPLAGRILFQTGWNDQAQRSEKIGPEFPVWSGLTVADIVDERELHFTCELPEDRFAGLAVGSPAELAFDLDPSRSVTAKVLRIGRVFTLPRDRLRSEGSGTVASRRAFTVTVAFTPPPTLAGRLATGAKGWLRLP
jgi:hypothetical protein